MIGFKVGNRESPIKDRFYKIGIENYPLVSWAHSRTELDQESDRRSGPVPGWAYKISDYYFFLRISSRCDKTFSMKKKILKDQTSSLEILEIYNPTCEIDNKNYNGISRM